MRNIWVAVGLTLLLYFSRVFVIFTPLPILVLFFKKGKNASLIALFMSFVLTGIVYFFAMKSEPLARMVGGIATQDKSVDLQILIFEWVQFVCFVWLILLMMWVGQSSLKREAGFAVIVLLSVAFSTGVVWYSSHRMGIHIVQELRSSFEQYYQNTIDTLSKSPDFTSDQGLVLQQMKSARVEKMLSLMPAMWIMVSFLVVSVNVLLTRRVAHAEGAFKSWKEFPLWRLDERMIWIPIVFGALYFLSVYGLTTTTLWKPIVQAVFENILFVICAVYAFQGLAIVSFFTYTKAPWLRSIFVYFFAFLFFYIVIPVLVGIGLFDFWFDFRKLKKIL